MYREVLFIFAAIPPRVCHTLLFILLAVSASVFSDVTTTRLVDSHLHGRFTVGT